LFLPAFINEEKIVAVTLRLARYGQKKRPFYRIVAAEKQNWRDGRFLEIVGTYNPMKDPALVTLKEDRIRRWVDVGAQTTDVVKSILKKHLPGVIEAKESARVEKIRAARRKRKERAKQRAQA
jgi:small subunit ribosomal protein S16